MKAYKTCRACGRPLKFLQTPAGKFMPCDTRAVFYIRDARGPHLIVTGNGVVVRGYILDKATRDCKAGLVPHWATCPGAKAHHTPRKKPPAKAGMCKCP